MKWLYLIFAILYLFSPYDILPDFLGLPGRLDDAAVLIYVYWKYFRENKPKNKTEENYRQTSVSARKEELDPYQVLEIRKGASQEDIESKYKLLMTKYHPDKVNHLGDELKKLAHEKSLEIKSAYEKLSKKT